MGLILLAGGLLWQFGIIDPLKMLDSAGPTAGKNAQPLTQKVPPKTSPQLPPSPPSSQVKEESAKTLVTKGPAAEAKQEPAPEVKVQVVAEKSVQETRSPVPASEPAVEKKVDPCGES